MDLIEQLVDVTEEFRAAQALVHALYSRREELARAIRARMNSQDAIQDATQAAKQSETYLEGLAW